MKLIWINKRNSFKHEYVQYPDLWNDRINDYVGLEHTAFIPIEFLEYSLWFLIAGLL